VHGGRRQQADGLGLEQRAHLGGARFSVAHG
jgi:hypothetical protein